MINAGERQATFQAFLQSGRLSSARSLRPDELAWGKSYPIVAAVEGNIEVDRRSVTLRVGVCPRFPLTLPHLFVVPSDAVGTIPHIESDGRICYRPTEGLLLDHHAPSQILDEALDAAIQTLEEGVSGSNWHDFVDELEAYWRQIATGRSRLPSFVEPDDRLRRLEVGKRPRERALFVADSFGSVQGFFGDQRKSPPLYNALYVPLTDSVLTEHFTPRDFMCLDWTRSFVQRHLTKENREELDRLRKKLDPRALLVLGVPRRKGGKGLVGIEYREVSNGNPLCRGTTPQAPHHVALERCDRAISLSRAEGGLELQKKRVAIAGCGAVGGHLALHLARSGVGHLTLIDSDALHAENTFRHVLGKSAIGARKVYALKQEITSKVPYIEVDVHDKRIEEVLQMRNNNFATLDLLIYAAGDLTVGLHVNERLHQRAEGPGALFTWLEPYGIGGHALLSSTRDVDARGCYGCLFDSPIDGEPRRNRADFAGPEQSFVKDVSGCAAMYTPYADLDAVRTAELAARLALDFLRGRSVGHPLLSWKGDDEAFRSAGFRTSARYGLGQKELHEQRFNYARGSCAICRSVP